MQHSPAVVDVMATEPYILTCRTSALALVALARGALQTLYIDISTNPLNLYGLSCNVYDESKTNKSII